MTASLEQQVVVPCCPLCGSEESVEHARFAELTWVRCACGVIYKRSVGGGELPVAATSSDSYGEQGYGRRYDARAARRVRKSRQQIREALAYGPGGPLLDVGCSLGYTLQAACDLGLAASGIDLSDVAMQRCRDLGFDARVAPMDALPWPPHTFGIVVMKHVLEHTAQPRAALREVRRVLRPGGALFVAVPDPRYRKAARAPLASRFFRPDAHGGVEHWVYYTPATLARLLQEEGFAPEPLRARAWDPARVALAVRARFALAKEFWAVARVPG